MVLRFWLAKQVSQGATKRAINAIQCIGMDISDDAFQNLIDDALTGLPKRHTDNLKNVAILFANEPTLEQRQQLRLRDDQSLFGLYEGTPLAFRQGNTMLFPDRITLFKGPLVAASSNMVGLQAQIKHTLWHEIGHYYGLDHARIHELERNWDK
jgi:predicted Zn-dependent protease with MMP-like domain